ncbi:MAG: uracil phosphoribosyltransferase, partial [Pseudomonadota bacterium]
MHVEVTHPCIRHKLSLLRDRGTGHKMFRELASEITMFVAYEALKELKTAPVTIETPLTSMTAETLADDVVVVPVLRAGIGMLDSLLSLVPTARVGFVGLYRDPRTKAPVEYYCKLPEDMRDAQYVIVDPMLATGGSTAAAIDLIKKTGATRVAVVAIVTCPEGLAVIE